MAMNDDMTNERYYYRIKYLCWCLWDLVLYYKYSDEGDHSADAECIHLINEIQDAINNLPNRSGNDGS